MRAAICSSMVRELSARRWRGRISASRRCAETLVTQRMLATLQLSQHCSSARTHGLIECAYEFALRTCRRRSYSCRHGHSGRLQHLQCVPPWKGHGRVVGHACAGAERS